MHPSRFILLRGLPLLCFWGWLLGCTVSGPALAHDFFANRLLLQGHSLLVTGSNLHASLEPGEPEAFAGFRAKTVWWTWTAPAQGQALIVTSNSLLLPVTAAAGAASRLQGLGGLLPPPPPPIMVGDTNEPTSHIARTTLPILSVYTGNTINSLVRLARTRVKPVAGGGLDNWFVEDSLSFPVTAGTTYQIAAEGCNGNEGAIVFQLSAPEPVVNDLFAQRTPLTGTQLHLPARTLGASREAGEPQHHGVPGTASAWWSWQAPARGRVALSLSQTSFQPVLAVYRGTSLPTLTEVAGGSFTAGFLTEPGQVYQIAVDGAEAGTFTLNLQFDFAPVNDHFQDRISLRGSSLLLQGNGYAAGSQTGEPTLTGLTPQSLWWSWMAPTNGTVLLDVSQSAFIPLMAVYTGSSLDQLTPWVSGPGPLSFPVRTGTLYHLQINGSAEEAEALFSVRLLGPPVEKRAPTLKTTTAAALTTMTNDSVLLGGTARDETALDSVVYQINGGPFLPASGTTNWQARLLLQPGINVVRFKSLDASGNASPLLERRFLYRVFLTLPLSTLGQGSITRVPATTTLELGRKVALKAVPKAGHLFLGWTGSTNASVNALSFLMNSNLSFSATFVTNPFPSLQGAYSGLISFADPHRAPALFSLQLNSRGAFSAKLAFGKKIFPCSGLFSPTGSVTLLLPRPGTNALSLSLQLQGADQSITGAIQENSSAAPFRAEHAWVASRSIPNPLAGTYSLQLAPDTDSGTLSVDKAGIVRATTVLPDGVPIAFTATLSRQGNFPLFLPLKTGFLTGWMQFSNSPTLGTAAWFKTGGTTASNLTVLAVDTKTTPPAR